MLMSFDGVFELKDSLFLEDSNGMWVPSIKKVRGSDHFIVNFEHWIGVFEVGKDKRIVNNTVINDIHKSKFTL